MALCFAAGAHGAIGQRRKYTGEPYIQHPMAVADIVRHVTDDPGMIAAAYLHDVVEDTQVTIEDVRSHFGVWIAARVADLTDISRPEDGNREIRKAIDRNHSATAHAFDGGPPILFETLVFGGPIDGECKRYTSWDDAARGHADMIGRVKLGACLSNPGQTGDRARAAPLK